jgi:predicted metal-dependent enzyme (double-stranded beta helix superfamily)
MMGSTFDIDDFVTRCQEAQTESEPRRAIREVLGRALRAPADISRAMAPTEAGLTILHHTADLTILHVVWAPKMTLYPHDHRMWAMIGIYEGAEDNTFYRRVSGTGTLTESGGKRLDVSDTVVLGDDTIHSVANPGRGLTGAIHIYGGDFVNEPRSQWGPGPLEERPYDLDDARRRFDEANAAWRAESG